MDCKRCENANRVFNDHGKEIKDFIPTYFLDCESIWKDKDERNAISSCDPKNRNTLPHYWWFHPKTG